MNRYLRTLFLTLVASLFAVSCANEMELSEPLFGDDEITLVPRVHSFSNKYVTKADAGDAAVKSMTVFVYDGNGQCVYTKDVGNVTPFTLNKSLLAGNTGMNNASVVLVANAKIADFKTNTNSQWTSIGDKPTLAKFKASSYVYTDATAVLTALPEAGLPMVGITEGVDLTPTSTEAVEIPLKILYAKVNFTVDVVDGGENQNTVEGGMTFTFDETASYTIHNVATVTPLSEMPDYSASAHVFTGDSKKAVDLSGSRSTSLAGNDAVSFTFYMAETRYTPTTSLGSVYPSSWDATDNYAAYNHLKQQYKPVLATTATGYPETGLATYVNLNGTYKDYRGKDWDVSYKIYLGKDNHSNFQVDRNSEYTNLISIKGIRNTGDSGSEVWIDHRVDVSADQDDASKHVKITRETLLDSHFEVRPLRVQWKEDANGNSEYTGVRLYLPTDSEGNLLNWIGVERFTGENCQASATYCYQTVTEGDQTIRRSTGKRRYFTQNLISELNAKTGEFGIQQDGNGKFVDLRNGDCAWIYFDENTSGGTRQAAITLQFYLRTYKEVEGGEDGEDGEVEETEELKELVEYTIKQNGLASVTLGEGTSAKIYQFESYEEYLHSYDATDTYSLSTSPIDYTQQGLKWGYKDTTLSHKEFVSATQVPNLGLADLKDVLSQRYDYFHPSDDPDNTYHIYVDNNGSWIKNDAWKTGRSGLYFTDKAMHDRMETVIDMGTAPKNAYQYCLSKNKFEVTASGDVNMKIHWYLPDAYQLQDILANPTEGLSSEAYYWSSQPSFTGREYNILTKISFKAEDAANARAVKSEVGEANLDRTQRHRIRCLYSKDGVVAQDMNKRIPDGIGVNLTFDMKAYLDPTNKDGAKGYFNNLVSSLQLNENPKVITPYTYYVKEEGQTDAELANDDDNKGYLGYPTPQNNDNTYFKYTVTTDKEGNTFEGFEVDPDVTSNWQEYNLRDGYYYALAVYPGLSNYELDKAFANAYKETTTQKKDTKVVEDAPYYELNASLPNNSNLQSLDEDGRLTISFAKQDGSNDPSFNFHEYTEGNRITYTRNWIKPEYNAETREMLGDSRPLYDWGNASVTFGESVLERIAYSQKDARKYAFEGVNLGSAGLKKGAYELAKENALAKINTQATKNGLTEDNGWTMSISYTQLSYTSTSNTDMLNNETRQCVVYSNEGSNGRLVKTYYCTCTVNLVATATFTKPGQKTLYVQVTGTSDTPGTGCWSNETPGTPEPIAGGTVDTDQLRIYSGNSFTILVNNDNLQQGQQKYKITDIKVHYSKSNFIRNYNTGNLDKAYARFVDASKTLPYTEAVGMEYEENDNGGMHHWSGDGGQSVTLLLADYLVERNSSDWFGESYKYTTASKDKNFYLIVDKIQVQLVPIE